MLLVLGLTAGLLGVVVGLLMLATGWLPPWLRGRTDPRLRATWLLLLALGGLAGTGNAQADNGSS